MAQFVNFWNGRGYWTTQPADRRIRLAAQCGQVVDDFAAAFAEDWPLAAVGDLAMPVLLVMGLQSQPASMRITEMLAETIDGARLIVVPYGGHMTPFTHPAIVNSAITRYIRLAEAGVTSPLVGSAPAGGQRAA
jgi:pimeloyl-ACP methyl ester carboxylesterase